MSSISQTLPHRGDTECTTGTRPHDGQPAPPRPTGPTTCDRVPTRNPTAVAHRARPHPRSLAGPTTCDRVLTRPQRPATGLDLRLARRPGPTSAVVADRALPQA
jgi:hypothetical protein